MGIIMCAAEVAKEWKERIHVLIVLPDDECVIENVIIFKALSCVCPFHLLVFT